MKVTIIFLDYHRHDFTERTKAHNFANAGYPFEVITVDRLGVAAALNEGIKQAMDNGADAVVTMANDILMPDGWLAQMVEHAIFIENTGMCGVHVVEELPPVTAVPSLLSHTPITVHKIFTAFGNVLIPRKAIETIGYFNEEYDPYGMQDGDYAYRLNATGFTNYYIPGLKAQHIGDDVLLDTPYRKMKNENLAKAPAIWAKNKERYDDTGNYYLPYEQSGPIIEQQQFEGE